MITTSMGNVCGNSFGKMRQEISQFILGENYRKETKNASDMQKYRVCKEKMDATFKNYVNMEINRMLAQEKWSSVKNPNEIYERLLKMREELVWRRLSGMVQGRI